MKRETQRAKVKRWLLNDKTLTPIEALEMFGCFRLAHIIWDIRQNRHVYTRMIKHPRYGTSFAEYSFKPWSES